MSSEYVELGILTDKYITNDLVAISIVDHAKTKQRSSRNGLVIRNKEGAVTAAVYLDSRAISNLINILTENVGRLRELEMADLLKGG